MGILLDQIEKLINEHGSAVILKERIELAKDEQAALERKNDDLADEVTRLRGHIKLLEADKEKLEKQLGALNRIADKPRADLHEIEISMVKILAQQGNLAAGQIARALGIHHVKAEHYLQRLKDAGYVDVSYFVGSPAEYSLGQKGNEYAVVNGIV